MKHIVPGGIALVAATLLSACAGGGGSSPANPPPTSAPTGSPTSTPKPSPTPTATPTTATANGTVVDEAANTPLSGVKVAIAAYTHGAAATQVTSTDVNGKFSFTTSPGTYFLVVGSDSPTDIRATLHEKIVLTAGSNTLTQPIPPSEPNVTLTAAQTSKNVRLLTLNANDQDCLSGANAGRTSLGLTALIPDEYLMEMDIATATEALAQQTDTPSPLFNGYAQYAVALGGLNPSGGTTATGSTLTSCSAWTGTAYSYVSGSPPYPYAADATNLYYGADSEINPNITQNTPVAGMAEASQDWARDPR